MGPTRIARWTCMFGFLPLTVGILLVLPLDTRWLRCCSTHWFWGSLGDQLSLPVLLGHNFVFQFFEGVLIVGPNWDYPFSWALWLMVSNFVLLVLWAVAVIGYLLVLGPCAEFCGLRAKFALVGSVDV